MHRIDLVEKLAELQQQFADAHRHVRSLDQYRVRHARRHPELLVKQRQPHLTRTLARNSQHG